MGKEITPRDWEAVQVVCRYLMIGYSTEQAASMAGVNKSTVLQWQKQPWWHDAMKESTSKEFQVMAAKALGNIAKSLDDGDVSTSKWFLNKVHHILGENARAGAAQIETEVIDVKALDGLSDDELREVAGVRTKEDDFIEAAWAEVDEEFKDG